MHIFQHINFILEKTDYATACNLMKLKLFLKQTIIYRNKND